MNTTAIIRVLFIIGLFVVGWSGLALAGETCPTLSPFLPGGQIITVDDENQLGDVLGDPTSIADAGADVPTAPPGSIVYIVADITLTAAQTGGDGVTVTVNDVVIAGCTLNPPDVTTSRKVLITADGTGGASAAFTFTGLRNVLFDPIIDCAGAATAITVAAGANNTVLDTNDIITDTGACTTAGIRVLGTSTTATTGTRIIRNRFVADTASGNAILVSTGANGLPNTTSGDIPPFTQCTAAASTPFGGTFFSTSAHSVIGDANANAAGAPSWAAAPLGNVIVGVWADGVAMAGGEWCIRGNLIGQGPGATGTGLTILGAAGVAGAVGDGIAGAVCDGTAPGDGICLEPEAKGTAIWGNALMGFGSASVDDAIHIQGPFPINNPTLTVLPDSVYDNIMGDVASSGWDDDGLVCEDLGLFIQGSAQGNQRANFNGDDGFDMTDGDGDNEGAGCTKRAPIFNNDAIGNGANGFEGGSDFIDNDADNNGGDGFALDFGGAEGDGHRFCGNTADDNGDDGYDVRDNNQFLKALVAGSATCARGNQTVTLIAGPPSVTRTGSNHADSNGDNGFEARDGNTFEASVATRNGANGFSVRDNNNFKADPNFADCNAADGFVGDNSNTFNGSVARSNTSSGIHVTGASNKIYDSLAGSLAATGDLCATVQANGLEVDGGGANTSNRAWNNVFGAGTRRGGTETAARGNVDGIQIDAGVLRLNEGTDASGPTGLPTTRADLDLDGKVGEACNTMASNTAQGVFLTTAATVDGNLQVLDDEDGAGGAFLSNIYEQAGTPSGADPNDIENDSGETVKMEGLWTLVTVGPTPDIFVDGDSASTVQVSSPRNSDGSSTATTVDQLYSLCAVGASGGGTPGPSFIVGDVDQDGDFDGDDVDALLNALRSKAPWTKDSSDQKFQSADVARPCGRITRADYSRLRSSFLRVQRGRSPLASQCGSKGIIGQAPPAGALMTVLSGQAGAATVQVTVYSLTGRLLFEQKAAGAQVALDLAQRELANGVYLAVVTSVGPDGRVVAREVRKFVVLR